jgi:Protein of unknown function (DUF2933)
MMKCVNKNVLIVGAAVAVGVLALRPAWAVAALPLLLLALCPLSMILMMRGMTGGHARSGSPASSPSHPGAPSAADSPLNRQVADLQEEVRILRAALVQRQADDGTVPPPVDLGKPDQPGPRP